MALGIDDVTDYYGKPFPFDFYPDSVKDQMNRDLRRVKETGEIATLEAPVPTLTGQEIWFHSTFVPVRGRDGLVEYIIVVSADVTERKQMDGELVKMTKLESVGLLAGGIAHDLNNMLAGILGNLSMARLSDEREERDEFLEGAERASLQLKDLNHQILTFSKGGSPILSSINPGDLLRESAQFSLHGSSTIGDFNLPSDLWDVSIDAGQINQVVNNLIINAEQAMSGEGTITIAAQNTTVESDSGLPVEPGDYCPGARRLMCTPSQHQ